MGNPMQVFLFYSQIFVTYNFGVFALPLYSLRFCNLHIWSKGLQQEMTGFQDLLLADCFR